MKEVRFSAWLIQSELICSLRFYQAIHARQNLESVSIFASLTFVGFAYCYTRNWISQVALVVKKPPANAGDAIDVGLIPGLGRSPGGGHGTPLQHSCLENPTDRGASQAAVHGVTKSQT